DRDGRLPADPGGRPGVCLEEGRAGVGLSKDVKRKRKGCLYELAFHVSRFTFYEVKVQPCPTIRIFRLNSRNKASSSRRSTASITGGGARRSGRWPSAWPAARSR